MLVGGLFLGCSGDDDTDDASEGSSSDASGGDTASSDEEAAVDILAAELADGDAPNAVPFDDEEARCTAEGLVDQLGVGRMAELGVETATGEVTQDPLTSMTDEESVAAFDVILECTDAEGELVDILISEGMSQELAGCVAGRYLETDLPRRSVMSEYDPELNAEIDAALAEAETACRD